MMTRILNSAFFVLAVGCSSLLPNRLLAQGEGPRSVGALSGVVGPGAAEGEAGADPRVSSLAPRAQKAIGKAFEALGSHATLTAQGATQVRRHLETAYRVAPTSAEVSYLFGVYWLQVNNRVKAKAYWAKAIELYPQHYRSLIAKRWWMKKSLTRPCLILRGPSKPSLPTGGHMRSTRISTCDRARR